MSVRVALLVLHVLGAVIALGFSLSYGLWVRRGEASGASERAFALATISWVDRRITTPAFVLQAITGLLLVSTIGWSLLRAAWLEVSLGLYVALTVLAITVYAPAFRRQRDAAERVAAGTGSEDEYRAAARTSTRWGVTVTAMTLAILILMVWKPALWGRG